MGREPTISAELSENNERQTNYLVALILVLFSLSLIVMLFVFQLDGAQFPFAANGYPLFGMAIAMLIPALFQWAFPKNLKIMKYILLPTMLLGISVLEYSFSYAALAILAIPTLLSTRYYSKRYTLSFIIATILSLLITSLIVWKVASGGNYTEPVAAWQAWDDLKEVLLYNFLIQAIMYLLIAFLSYLLMIQGWKMIDRQVKITQQKTQLTHEAMMAGKIQQSDLPTNFGIASENGLKLDALMRPAKDAAGDFYDFFTVGDDLYFLVGDVSDKGLYAAMFMMNVKNTIHALAIHESSLEKVIDEANALINEHNEDCMFVTLWIGKWSMRSHQGVFINAGHCPALIKKNDGSIIELENEPQPFIGLAGDISYHQVSFDFHPGETLLLYTDGATDALSLKEESFGKGRLISEFSKQKESLALCQPIYDAIVSFTQGVSPFDDITLLSLSYEKKDSIFRYTCDHDGVNAARENVNSFLKEHKVSEENIEMVDTALDEAMDNIVCYAYEKDKLGFDLTVEETEGGYRFILKDEGKPFDPLSVDAPDLSENRKIGGLGIHLMKNIMDDVSYQREGNFNILTLTKRVG